MLLGKYRGKWCEGKMEGGRKGELKQRVPIPRYKAVSWKTIKIMLVVVERTG